ncbi:MAG TPA: hypothetical protein EYP86_05250 [Candidatus Altiarchaeales archaeon]|nr:hypothetical protein [Candidatus Altiarchaeales archaeon]
MYELDEFQKDALKELGNLGSGRASSELSKLIDMKVNLDVSFVDLVPTDDVPDLVGGPRMLVVGTYAPVQGDVIGTIVVVFPIKSALMFVDLVNKREFGTTNALSIKDRDTIREIGDILSKSYLQTFAEFLNINAEHTTPRIVSAFGESLPDFVLLNIQEKHALLLKTEFNIPTAEKINGNFVLLLTSESIEKLLDALKEKLQ